VRLAALSAELLTIVGFLVPVSFFPDCFLKVYTHPPIDVGMSDTSRQITPRRPPAAVVHTAAHTPAPAARIEALRRLVAAGRYQVNAKALAHRICQVARVQFDD
jgi:hypothetical protein